MICFNLLFIMLFQPHDPRIVFNGLIHVNLTHFSCYFLINFFYKFYHSTIGSDMDDWKLSFIIYFNLLFIGLT